MLNCLSVTPKGWRFTHSSTVSHCAMAAAPENAPSAIGTPRKTSLRTGSKAAR